MKPLDALDGYDFGACECGRPGSLVYVILPDAEAVFNVAACHECKTGWLVGMNLFSGWMHDGEHEDEEEWLVRSTAFLETYRQIPGDIPPWALEAIHRENERAMQRSGGPR